MEEKVKRLEEKLNEMVDELYKVAMETGTIIQLSAGQWDGVPFSHKEYEVQSTVDGSDVTKFFKSYEGDEK